MPSRISKFEEIVRSSEFKAKIEHGGIDRYDEIDLSMSRYIDDEMGHRFLEWTDDAEAADVFTVQFHLKAGHTEELNDFETLEEAEAFAEFLSSHTGLPTSIYQFPRSTPSKSLI